MLGETRNNRLEYLSSSREFPGESNRIPQRAYILMMPSQIALFGLLLATGFTEHVSGAPPNIVHIIADDLGWNDVGFHGSEIQTPAIDQLATESVVLERFYVTPICSPTRAGVLTGRYPFRFGIWDGVVSPTKRHGLPPHERTTPELLAAAGYRNRAVFGKWHLGLSSTIFHPLNHGFTEFYGHYNGAIDYFSRKRFGQLDWHRNFKSVHEQGYSTDLLGAASVDFIEQQRIGAPFYLLLTFNAPHSPIQARAEDLDRYGFDRARPRAKNTDKGIAKREGALQYGERGKGNTVRQTFAAMTTAMDRNIKNVLDAIDQKGFRDNTLVIFHSDNGGAPKHGGSNTPLRGNKFTTWEGGVRVVAMMRWPAMFVEGRRFTSLTSYVDLLPTQLAAAGQPIPDNLDGINLLPFLIRQTPAPDREILLGKNAVVSNRWKLVGDELFDLASDPNETSDVAESHPGPLEKLRTKAARFAQLEGPEFVTTNSKPIAWPPVEWNLPVESNTPVEDPAPR